MKGEVKIKTKGVETLTTATAVSTWNKNTVATLTVQADFNGTVGIRKSIITTEEKSKQLYLKINELLDKL